MIQFVPAIIIGVRRLVFFLTIFSTLSAVAAFSQDYKKVCEQMWANPFTRLALRQAPVIVYPQNGDKLSPKQPYLNNDSNVGPVGEYTSIGQIFICVDPSQQKLKIEQLQKTHSGSFAQPEKYRIDEHEIAKQTMRHLANILLITNREYRLWASYSPQHQSDNIFYQTSMYVNSLPDPAVKNFSGPFTVTSPAEGNVYAEGKGKIAVKIVMPKNIPAGSYMMLKWYWGRKGDGIDDPGTLAKLIASYSVNDISKFSGKIYERLEMPLSIPGPEKKYDGYFQLQAELRSGNTLYRTAKSGSFSLVEPLSQAERGIKIISPQNNQSYWSDINIHLQFTVPKHQEQPTILFTCYYLKKSLSPNLPKIPVQVYNLGFSAPEIPGDFWNTMKKSFLLNKAGVKSGTFELRVKVQLNKNWIRTARSTFHLGSFDESVVSHKFINQQKTQSAKVAFNVLPIKHLWRKMEVTIGLENADKRRLEFELRFRPKNGRPFEKIERPLHKYTQKGATDFLDISLKKGGQYQVRFRANSQDHWGNWQSFQVLSQSHRFSSVASARMINPQPEPPGKQMHPMTGSLPRAASGHTLRLVPVIIREPANGKKYMLSSGGVHIAVKVDNRAARKLRLEVEQKKNGRFLNISSATRQQTGHGVTTIALTLKNTGDYRLRVKPLDRGGKWSGWRMFSVDTLQKHSSTLSRKPLSVSHVTPSGKKTIIGFK